MIVYLGDIVEVLEQFYENGIRIEMGSDQTSLQNHRPGGYYPADLTFHLINQLIKDDSIYFFVKSIFYCNIVALSLCSR